MDAFASLRSARRRLRHGGAVSLMGCGQFCWNGRAVAVSFAGIAVSLAGSLAVSLADGMRSVLSGSLRSVLPNSLGGVTASLFTRPRCRVGQKYALHMRVCTYGTLTFYRAGPPFFGAVVPR